MSGEYTIASWLTALELSAYLDNFHQAGLEYMYQLQEYSLEVIISFILWVYETYNVYWKIFIFLNLQS